MTGGVTEEVKFRITLLVTNGVILRAKPIATPGASPQMTPEVTTGIK